MPVSVAAAAPPGLRLTLPSLQLTSFKIRRHLKQDEVHYHGILFLGSGNPPNTVQHQPRQSRKKRIALYYVTLAVVAVVAVAVVIVVQALENGCVKGGYRVAVCAGKKIVMMYCTCGIGPLPRPTAALPLEYRAFDISVCT